jgi:hypothetical protein
VSCSVVSPAFAPLTCHRQYLSLGNLSLRSRCPQLRDSIWMSPGPGPLHQLPGHPHLPHTAQTCCLPLLTAARCTCVARTTAVDRFVPHGGCHELESDRARPAVRHGTLFGRILDGPSGNQPRERGTCRWRSGQRWDQSRGYASNRAPRQEDLRNVARASKDVRCETQGRMPGSFAPGTQVRRTCTCVQTKTCSSQQRRADRAGWTKRTERFMTDSPVVGVTPRRRAPCATIEVERALPLPDLIN